MVTLIMNDLWLNYRSTDVIQVASGESRVPAFSSLNYRSNSIQIFVLLVLHCLTLHL